MRTTARGSKTHLRIVCVEGLTGVGCGTNGRPCPTHTINDTASELRYPKTKSQECCAPATLAPLSLGCPIGGGCSGGGRVAGGGRIGRASAISASDTEPVENVVGLDRNVMVYTSSADGLEVRAVG
jgi:hypothetical protein